jgi:hypothetical protein
LIDGATVSHGQRQRRVEVRLPRQTHRRATQDAMPLADMADQGVAPPSRADQTRARVPGVEPRWAACAVPLHACVLHVWHKKNKQTEHSIVVTTDRTVRASWMGRPYDARPESEPDDAQMHSGAWHRTPLRSTR